MAYDPTAAATELDAVNEILQASGEARVSTITSSPLLSVNEAIEALSLATRQVCSDHWEFNTDECYELEYETDSGAADYKMIAQPANAIMVDPSLKASNYVLRYNTVISNFALYDKYLQTFELEKNVECDIRWAFTFEQIPEPIRNYVFIRAARKYQASRVGSNLLYEFTLRDEQEAEMKAKQADGEFADRNFLTGTAEANYIWIRTSNPVRYG